MELFDYQALLQTIQYSVLLSEAKKSDIKIEKSELNAYIDQLIIDLKLKDEKELRKQLKKIIILINSLDKNRQKSYW